MKFNLVKACNNCPFLKDGGIRLTRARVREIAGYVAPLDGQGGTFACHKTTDLDSEEGYAPRSSESHCAGALAFAMNVGRYSQMGRIAMRTGTDFDAIEEANRGLVFEGLAEMLASAHDRRAEREPEDEEDEDEEEAAAEPCSVVDPGCQAPAGYAVGGRIADGTVNARYRCDTCYEPVCGNCSKRRRAGKHTFRVCGSCIEQERQDRLIEADDRRKMRKESGL